MRVFRCEWASRGSGRLQGRPYRLRDGAVARTFAGYRVDQRAHGGIGHGRHEFTDISDARHADRLIDGIDKFLRALRPLIRRQDAGRV